MAKLDTIVLKHSVAAEDDFLSAIQTGSNQIIPGELVIRRHASGFELWSLDAGGNPSRVSVDITGEIPAWNPNDLGNGSLAQLGDVNIEADGGLSSAQAGQLLTWDGIQWVVRPAPGFEQGIISSLNDSGDVNYSHYASAGKYLPSVGDVLRWRYNEIGAKYEWAPSAFDLRNADHCYTFNGTLGIDSEVIRGITFKDPDIYQGESYGIRKSGGFTSFYFEQFGQGEGAYRITPDRNLELVAGDSITLRWSGDGPERPVYLRYEADSKPGSLPDDDHIPALSHVRSDWGNHNLHEIADIDTTGLVGGQVLTWNSLSQTWKPTSGVAPDLSVALINELADVNTYGAERGQALVYDSNDGRWKPENVLTTDIKWDDFGDFYDEDAPDDITNRCRECNQDNVGRITTVSNIPYICLRARTNSNDTQNAAGRYAWVRLLLDGNGFTRPSNGYGPAEYLTSETGGSRDPLALVAYTGSIESLSNVNTTGRYNGSTLVYNPSSQSYITGYPDINLGDYSIGQLGDVDPTNVAIGYGLTWDGQKWITSSLEQKVRLDDLQDVQFGTLGVSNTRLVAAFMLADGDHTPYRAEQNVAPVLAVAIETPDANLGNTRAASSPEGFFYSNAREFWFQANWGLSQKLNHYIRWEHDSSWQNIDGDGCIELFFRPLSLLHNRSLFRKSASISSLGGYHLLLTGLGGLEFSVNGSEGYVGFTHTTASNIVSLDNWHHVAITKEGNTQRLYLDGDLIFSTTSSAPWTGDGVFSMGRHDLDDANGLTHYFFKGHMLDLRVTKGRAKYTGNSLTVPGSLEAEIVDTTPNAGDLLGFDGTKWTNINGVQADISSNSINELVDVDTTSQNPGTGDALVWTGNQWEPGIPGVGSSWGLDDFTDVSTSYNELGGTVYFDQATMIALTDAFLEDQNDLNFIQGTDGSMLIGKSDYTYSCGTGPGPYAQSSFTGVGAAREGYLNIYGVRAIIQNEFTTCSLPPKEHHETVLHYRRCPDRGPWAPGTVRPDGGDIPGEVDDTFVPCWGVIEDHIDEALAYGAIGDLGNVSPIAPSLGQVLAWDGGNWSPCSSVAADVSNNSIGDLADVDTSAALNGKFLKYDSGNWVPGTPVTNLLDLPGFSGNDELFDAEGELPIPRASFVSAQENQAPPNGGYLHENFILDLEAEAGFRGIRFGAHDSNSIAGRQAAYLYGLHDSGGSTVLTSSINETKGSFLELNPAYVRVGDAGDISNGVNGFRFSPGWVAMYEDNALTWDSFELYQLPHKGSIIEYVTDELSQISLNTHSLNDLGDVDTTGKGAGYALVWDEVNQKWIASAGVAADLSLSSIGDLLDVTKTNNTDLNTNDGSISLNVSQLETSRPAQTGGGMVLNNSAGEASWGWSADVEGSPLARNTKAKDAGTTANETFLRLDGDKIQISADAGIVAQQAPALSDNTLPTYGQVKRAIVSNRVDEIATFLITGESLREQLYNLPFSFSFLTNPNPVYFSPFSSGWSLNFDKNNKDTITWSTVDGAPNYLGTNTPWSFSTWVYVPSTGSSDGYPQFIVAPIHTGASTGRGLTIYLKGDDRQKVVCTTFGQWYSRNTPDHSGASIEGELSFDTWTHLTAMNDGGGAVSFYVNGVLAGSTTTYAGFIQTDGWSIGGRTENSTNGRGYFSGHMKDIMLTMGWLPANDVNGTIPVPQTHATGYGLQLITGTLTQMSDVDLTSAAPTNGQALVFNGLTNNWEAATSPGYDISTNAIGDLVDVTTNNQTPSQDDILAWDTSSSAWRRTRIDSNGGVRPLIARTTTPGLVPSSGNLLAGELYLNMTDKKLYALDSEGVAFTFASGTADATYDRIVGGDF